MFRAIEGRLEARFGVPFQPAWVFVNDDGRAQVVPSAISEDDLQQTLDQLVAQ